MFKTRINSFKGWMLTLTAVLSIAVVMLSSIDANATAATPSTPSTATVAVPANLKQTSAFGSYAKIRWDAVSGTGVKYQIDVSQNNTTWATLATVGNTYYTISKMETGKPYYFRVKAIAGSASGQFTTPLQVITQPGFVSEIKQTAAKNNSVTVSWSQAAGAAAYDVYIGTAEDNVAYNATVKDKTSITISKLKKNKNYIVKIVPFNISPSGYRADGFERTNSAIRTIPGKVAGLNVTAWNYGSANISVAWTAKDNVDGYQVKFYNESNKCVKTINTASTTAAYTKAGANTFYKVRIRPYLTINGKKKYGAFNTTPVYAVSQPQLTAFTQAPGKLTLAWNPVAGATSYSIYVTTTNPNTPSSYSKVATVDGSVGKYELAKIGTADITVLDNYYGYVVAEKKVGSKTYTSKVSQAWYCSNN